jgi:hypothetical protein
VVPDEVAPPAEVVPPPEELELVALPDDVPDDAPDEPLLEDELAADPPEELAE